MKHRTNLTFKTVNSSTTQSEWALKKEYGSGIHNVNSDSKKHSFSIICINSSSLCYRILESPNRFQVCFLTFSHNCLNISANRCELERLVLVTKIQFYESLSEIK